MSGVDLSRDSKRVASRARWLRNRPVYLWWAFCIPAVAAFGHALAPGAAVFKGHDLGVVLALMAGLLVLFLWLLYRTPLRWSPLTYSVLGLVLLAWAYQVIRTQLDDSLFNLTAFLLPLVLIGILLKPASREDSATAMLTLSYSILVISALSLILGSFDLMPDGFSASDSGYQRLPILGLMGIESRWGGPFGSVNLASPAGGLLVVFGLSLRGWHRAVVATGGMCLLMLGGSRTAMAACIAACLVLLLWSSLVSRLKARVAVRFGVAALFVLVGLAVVLWRDPTLNGRVPIWTEFAPLAITKPLYGVGESGIRGFLSTRAEEPGVILHDHAHSVLMDIFLRYGGVLVVLTLAIYLLALAVAVGRLRSGEVGPLAVLVFVVVAGLAETIHSWNYWSIYVASIVWIAAVVRSEAVDGGAALGPIAKA